ncbi:FAD-dependent oxidoreductase [Blastopirellula marina]|uniref:FAD-dependent oxidoreductase n=1 Tax=Blastopirellula marina TaxID=124 RepID=A0A2S8FNF7_9BACT|nr:FAD-dependent oxidoreductase [Blastopirellula marina]PQO33721.1 FAD-dependent oxidoreductase [Blastopirellula marina]PTL43508.1 FAD-dependent oxidoreductase [Blastopirellula marina]
METIQTNVLIIGGGATGLWLLDRLRRDGRSALLVESNSLGTGQTIAAQGILHSGLKYSLQGLLTASARQAREMPNLWRKCLDGESQPNLAHTEIRSQSFYLWGTNSASSKLGMLGARLGLQVTPKAVSPHNAPDLLRACPGAIFRVGEQVISCGSFLANLAEANQQHILHVAQDGGTRLTSGGDGSGVSAVVTSADGRQVNVVADWVVLSAGQGNAALRQSVGLDPKKQQTRPLHMVMVRGGLPEFYGHCVDGATTRVSITSASTEQGEVVWQVGGQLAEEGVSLSRDQLIAKARYELSATLPGIDLEGAEWSTYRVDRAEGVTVTGGRPESFRVEREGNLLTAWPTKLVLVPQLVDHLSDLIAKRVSSVTTNPEPFADWPRPSVAKAPWDRETEWTTLTHSTSAAA